MLFACVGIRGTICLILALEVIMDVKFDATYKLQSKVCMACLHNTTRVINVSCTGALFSENTRHQVTQG